MSQLVAAPSFVGAVLRVLISRLVYPERAYTGKQLETLLLLTLAIEKAGMWPWHC